MIVPCRLLGRRRLLLSTLLLYPIFGTCCQLAISSQILKDRNISRELFKSGLKTWHFVQAYSHEAPLRILFNFVLNRIGMKFGRNVVHLNTHWLSESDFRLDVIISKRLPWRYLRRSVLCCHLGSENEASAASRCSRARYSSWSKHLYLFLLILYFVLLRLRMQEVSIKDVEDYKEAVLSVFDKNTDGRLSRRELGLLLSIEM